jgi:hypothetical protein
MKLGGGISGFDMAPPQHMCVKASLLAMVMLAGAGCAGNVTIPSAGIDHPANPRAAAAPLSSDSMIPLLKKRPQTIEGMQGMNHGSMQDTDHGNMQGADYGLRHSNMPSRQGMPDTEGVQHEH